MTALPDTLGWLREAEETVATWPDSLLFVVRATFPYPAERAIRMTDWLHLVAHVSTRHAEDPRQTAQRLAMYVKTYRERFSSEPSPDQMKDNA